MKNLLFGLMLLVGVVASTPAKAQYVVLVPVVPVVPVYPVYPVYSCRYVGPYLVWTAFGYQYQYQLVCGY